jgi:hypothetical protein
VVEVLVPGNPRQVSCELVARVAVASCPNTAHRPFRPYRLN